MSETQTDAKGIAEIEQFAAEYLMSNHFGSMLVGAGDEGRVGLRICFELLGQFASRWVIDCRIAPATIERTDEPIEAFDAYICWALTAPRFQQYIAGTYGMTQALRAGTLKICASKPNAIRLGRLFTAMSKVNIATLWNEPEQTVARRFEETAFKAPKLRRAPRRSTRGVSVRAAL